MSILYGGCSLKDQEPTVNTQYSSQSKLTTLQYTIQAGAFSNIDNAVRFSKVLSGYGLDAYYFFDGKFYKVRFGNYPSVSKAKKHAISLLKDQVIDDYYIVNPGSYSINNFYSSDDLIRDKLVETAKRFIGIPYKWGGESIEEGFDCSGLSMVVYKLNGFNLPRTSKAQYTKGKKVAKKDIKAGDLVFFGSPSRKKITHVGIYKGNNQFIHAPRRGKRIKIANLNTAYFKKRYVGAKTFLF